MPVLLFDIDGTLYQGHGVGRRAVEATLEARLGRAVDTSSFPFSGKTDPQIFRGLLADTSIVGDYDGDAPDLASTLEAYRTEMAPRLVEPHAEALPGAAEAVRRLGAAGLPVGLLTGNLEPLAYLKVEAIGMARALFPFGAYGSDDEDRNALPAIAAQRASSVLGRSVETRELVIVGDTPLDIACARAAVAVAVTTGRHGADDLADADLALDSLDGLTEVRIASLVG